MFPTSQSIIGLKENPQITVFFLQVVNMAMSITAATTTPKPKSVILIEASAASSASKFTYSEISTDKVTQRLHNTINPVFV